MACITAHWRFSNNIEVIGKSKVSNQIREWARVWITLDNQNWIIKMAIFSTKVELITMINFLPITQIQIKRIKQIQYNNLKFWLILNLVRKILLELVIQLKIKLWIKIGSYIQTILERKQFLKMTWVKLLSKIGFFRRKSIGKLRTDNKIIYKSSKILVTQVHMIVVCPLPIFKRSNFLFCSPIKT